MSNELLHADAGALEVTGRQFVSAGEQTQSIMSNMRNQLEGLQPSFQGSAANNFYNKMQLIFQEMQRVVDETVEIGNELQLVANRVRELQAAAGDILRD